MHVDTLNVVASGIKCLTGKASTSSNTASPFQYTPTYPGNRISVNLVGPFKNISELDPQFNSHAYNKFNDTLGINILLLSVSRPQSNAILERINKSIKYSATTLLQEGHTFEIALLIHIMALYIHPQIILLTCYTLEENFRQYLIHLINMLSNHFSTKISKFIN